MTFDGNGFHPGTVLFESPLLVDPPSSAFHTVTVNTGHLKLTPGATYAFVLDAFVAYDGVASTASVGLSYFKFGSDTFGTDYTDGYGAHLDVANGTGNRAGHFASDWFEDTDQDFSFRLTFSEPGVSILGTKKKDLVDATNSPAGQPLPSPNDDTIAGLGGRDKLLGLAGNDAIDGGGGNDKIYGGEDVDTLTGGNGGDKLWGEAGLNSFVLNVKLGQPFDRFKGFVPVDDTVLLDDAVFKALTPGALPATTFVVGKKATDDLQHVIYNSASGRLDYDKDGKGGHDPVHIAILPEQLALTAADFVVV